MCKNKTYSFLLLGVVFDFEKERGERRKRREREERGERREERERGEREKRKGEPLLLLAHLGPFLMLMVCAGFLEATTQRTRRSIARASVALDHAAVAARGRRRRRRTAHA